MANTDRIDRKVGGWNPQGYDARDKHLQAALYVSPKDLPLNYDQRPKWSPVYDQGDEGSCTGNGSAGLVDFNQKLLDYKWPYTPSRAFIYYNGRLVDGDDVTQDTGCTVRGVIAAIAKYGVCPEDGDAAWKMPYVAGEYATKPSDASYKDALLHTALKYESVPQNEQAVKSLLSQDIPVVFGFVVKSSFMTQAVATSGVMPKPGFFDSTEGGHCVVAVGYLSNYPAGTQGITDWIICRNSWGSSWGQSGYFLMPLKEVFLNTNLASDFWAITSLGAPPQAAG